jgi:23S rRNA pseudouridine955/2504/2580 synthase
MTRIPRFQELILQEDDDLIFLNKPALIASLDERGDQTAPSIVKMARKYLESAQLCHRLDKETSGIMVIAKNEEAYREMAMSFESRSVEKTYHAIAEGVWNVSDKVISLPLSVTKRGLAKIDREEGKAAETIVSALRVFRHFTLLSCRPVTGRLHQIRIHLASQHFPIAADPAYGGSMPMLSDYKRKFNVAKFEEEQPMMKRVALHAYSLRFQLGEKTYDVQAPYPKDFDVFLKLLEKFEG